MRAVATINDGPATALRERRRREDAVQPERAVAPEADLNPEADLDPAPEPGLDPDSEAADRYSRAAAHRQVFAEIVGDRRDLPVFCSATRMHDRAASCSDASDRAFRTT